MSNIVRYRQGDPAWGSQLLGHNIDRAYTLANFGCLITNFSMFLSTAAGVKISPAQLNQVLKANNGYVKDGGLLVWSAIPRLYSTVSDVGVTTDMAGLNTWILDNDNYAMLEVNNGAHWVWLFAQGLIVDPIDGAIKSWKTYPIRSARRFRIVRATSNQEVDMFTNPTNGDMRDARGWYNAYAERNEQWAKQSNLLAEVQQQLANALGEKADLAQALLDMKQTPIVPNVDNHIAMPDFASTYVPETRPRISTVAGVQHDYAGNGPDYLNDPGTRFEQAGTFVVDGVTLVRTRKSVEAGLWYGIPETVFDDGVSERPAEVGSLHVGLSMGQAIGGRLANWLSGILHLKRKK